MTARDPELVGLLVHELERHLAVIEGVLVAGELGDVDVARRSVHALKGSAGLVGETELASAMQRLERRLRDGDRSALSATLDVIRDATARLASGQTVEAPAWPVPPSDLPERAIDPAMRGQYLAEVADRLAQIDAALAGDADPRDALAEVFRHVHTIKGAAGAVGDGPTAWFCHGLEEQLRAADATAAEATRILAEVSKHRAVLGLLVEDSVAGVAALRGERRTAAPPRTGTMRPEDGAEGDATFRVSAADVDDLLERVGAMTLARERLGARAGTALSNARVLRKLRADLMDALRLIGPPRPWGAPAAALRRIERAASQMATVSEALERTAEQLRAGDAELREGAEAARKRLAGMRQTSLRGLFTRLSAAAHADARRLDRALVVQVEGMDESVDRRLSEQLVEPCMQLVRNAIAHGIEPADARASAGKPPAATLVVSGRRVGGRLVITIRDDGAGVDLLALRARAVEAGLVTELLAEAADDQTLLELLFLPGFSTRDGADLLAGRGVGLDITLASVQRLGGNIRLSSRHGRGFEARVDVPMESGLATVLWVRSGSDELAFDVSHAQRVRAAVEDDERVPHLSACLEPRPTARAPLVLDIDVGLDEPEVFTLGIDAVLGREEVLIRPLSPLLVGIGPFAGVVARGDGAVRLAIDPYALAPRARALLRVPEGRVSEPPSRPPPPSV